MKIVVAVLSVFILWPVSFALTFSILRMVHATDLMWLLFWGYVPLALIVGILGAIASSLED